MKTAELIRANRPMSVALEDSKDSKEECTGHIRILACVDLNIFELVFIVFLLTVQA